MSKNKFILDVKEFEKVVALYKTLPEKFQSDLDTFVKASAVTALETAIATSPIKDGFLRRSHFLRKASDYSFKNISWTIGNGAYYAPYLEFGTIDKVDVPRGFAGFARQFKSKNPVRESGGIDPQPWMIFAMNRGYSQLRVFMSRAIRKYWSL